jgi:DNA gyrase inhibitor GyrI
MNDPFSSDVSIEIMGPLRMACYRVASATPEEDAGWFMKEWYKRQNISVAMRHFGFDLDVTPEEKKAGFRGYEVWITVPAGVQPSEGVTMRDFAGGLYAVMTLYHPMVDPFARIPQGWKELHDWVIGSSQYQSGEHQWMEELVAREGSDDLKLYHPIMPVSAAS